jgi:COP9 signalosome complex subunit 6
LLTDSFLRTVKLVHKEPALDLVGWYTLVPKSGPTPAHLPIHEQILAQNESGVVLGFHVEDILQPVPGDPLPLTIYESNMEADDGAKDDADGEDKEMKDSEASTTMVQKFRELAYTTETGEAEIIAMQFIREGGANATVDEAEKRILEQFDKKIAVDDGKGKRRAVAQADAKAKGEAATKTNKDANLTKPESEYMSALQAKYNAVKMMKSRVDLIVTYLQNLPPDFITGTQTPADAVAAAQASGGKYTAPSNKILRQIQALVTNIELATPAQQNTLEKEILRETNDVNVVTMISDVLSSVNVAREAGKRFAMAEAARNAKMRQHSFETSSFDGYSHGAGDLL